MIQILIGHSKLKSFLHIIKQANDSIRECELLEVESCEHFIFRCPKYEYLRIHLQLIVEVLFLPWPFDLHVITKHVLLYKGVEEYVLKSKRLDFT